jgi:hypothetical protein
MHDMGSHPKSLCAKSFYTMGLYTKGLDIS